MKSNLLTRVFGSIALLGAISTPVSSQAGDYVQEQRFGLLGAGHTTTYTHTELGVVGYSAQKFNYIDECGCCRTGIQRTPIYGEVVTNKCKTSHVHWDKSVVAIPGNILTGIGRALTPPSRCEPVTCAPKPRTCAPRPATCAPKIYDAPITYDPIASRDQ